MEAVELSPEAREFALAAGKLAAAIRKSAAAHDYNLKAACQLVENGQLTIHNIYQDEGESAGFGFTGLPIEVSLFLTANACGGLFPQAPL